MTPDSPPQPDAPGPFVEMPIGFEGKDGGEVRIENLMFPDGVVRSLNMAYFLSAQDGQQPFPTINMDANATLKCAFPGDKVYPFADDSETLGSEATWTPTGRQSMDVGDKITFQVPDGSKPAFELIGYQNFMQPLSGGFFTDFSYAPDVAKGDPFLATDINAMGGAGQNAAGTKLKVTIPGGTPDLPEGRVFDFEGTFAGIEVPSRPVIKGCKTGGVDLPCRYATEGVPANGGGGPNNPNLIIPKNATYEVAWDVPTGSPQDLLTFIAIFDQRPQVAMLCVATHPGTMKLGTDMLTRLDTQLRTKNPSGEPSALMFVAHLLHRTRTFDNVRRIDMVGTACTSVNFTLQ